MESDNRELDYKKIREIREIWSKCGPSAVLNVSDRKN